MKKKISILILSFILLGCFTVASYASMQIVPGEEAQVLNSMDDVFAYCYNLRATSSTLGNNTLDPHLTTNKDWGAVAYLAASVYGCNMNETALSDYKTSGNNSGVNSFGRTYTSTAASKAGYDFSVWGLVKDYQNTKYVEIMPESGTATSETRNWGGSNSNDSYVGFVHRIGIFGYEGWKYDGISRSFRPVIWN